MKKYTVHIILGIIIIVLAVVIGGKYFNKQDSTVNSNSIETSEPVATATPTVEPTAEPAEAPHEHVYTETVTTEATCETDGLKTFTCDCGDSYTESIEATRHVFENYVYNNDATYFADGTQTAQCKHCEATDTQVALNSKLEELQTEDPQELAAKYLAETLGISIEEARAMLENGGNPVGNGGGGSTPVANPDTNQGNATDENYVTPETDNPSNGNPGGSGGNSGGNSGGGTDLNLTPGMGGDGGDLVTDGTLNP